MNFDYNEQQQLLADSVRRYLAKSYDFEARKKIVSGDGWSTQAWAHFAEMGLTGLPFSADHGGFGGGAVDLMGVLEAFGEALVVEPYLPLVVAARALERGASEALKEKVAPGVIEGRARLALAHAEQGSRYALDAVRASASRKGSGWTIEGEKAGVIGAPVAQHLVVSAKTQGAVQLFLVETARAELKPHRTIDERLAADVVLRGAPAEPLEGGVKLLEEVVDLGTALVCAEAVGAMKFTCDTTLEYLKTRKQFGVLIGTFQALKHRAANVYTETELSRSAVMAACFAIDEESPKAPELVSLAKARLSDAFLLAANEAIQMHGGIGMTDEHDIGFFLKRARVAEMTFGDAAWHRRRYAELQGY